MKRNCTKIFSSQAAKITYTKLRACFLPQNALKISKVSSTEGNSELFLFTAELFKTEWWEFSSIFVLQYGIPSIFQLHVMVWNRIPRDFCSGEQPETVFCLFCLPRNHIFVRNSQPFLYINVVVFRNKLREWMNILKTLFWGKNR